MRDLTKILDFFNKIDELNLEGVEPMFHPLSTGKLRPDEPAQPLSRDDALANVPKKRMVTL